MLINLNLSCICGDILPALKREASIVGLQASTTRAQANPRLTLAQIAHRCPCGFDVNRSIMIAVDSQPAVTSQHSIAQGEVMPFSTVRTELGGWRKAVDFHDRLAALQRDPFENTEETTKAKIAHLASPQGLHALQVEVFEVEGIVFITEAVRQLEVMIQSFVRDVCAVPGKRSFRSLVAMRSFHLVRQLAVEFARLAQVLREKLGAGVRSSFVVSEEGFQAEIKSAA